jgi:hypothetical protein
MKSLRAWSLMLAVSAALAVGSGCTEKPEPARRLGAVTSSNIQWLTSIPTITGNNATIKLFDTTGGSNSNRKGFTHVQRILGSLRCDQAITLLYQVLRTGSTTWRTMNGSGSGDAITASTDTAIDYLVLGPDSRLEAVTGGTGPSSCEVDVGLYTDRTPGM